LENLAKAVEANSFDSDLLIALGMQLFFDGQHDRAGVFFARAAQLGGNEDRLLNDFVPKPGPADAPKAQPAAKVVF
jgi:Flp pilus assembly protein TadD